MPIFLGIKKDSEDLVSAKNRIADLENQSREIEDFKENYTDYKSNLEKMTDMFVNLNDPVNFIEFLENTGSDCSLSIKIILPDDYDANSDIYESAVFQISAEGRFSDLMNFVKKLESSDYLIEIENISIQNYGVEEVQNYSYRSVRATLNIKVYTIKNGE